MEFADLWIRVESMVSVFGFGVARFVCLVSSCGFRIPGSRFGVIADVRQITSDAHLA